MKANNTSFANDKDNESMLLDEVECSLTEHCNLFIGVNFAFGLLTLIEWYFSVLCSFFSLSLSRPPLLTFSNEIMDVVWNHEIM